MPRIPNNLGALNFDNHIIHTHEGLNCREVQDNTAEGVKE